MSVQMILLMALHVSNAVIILPDSNDPYITAELLNPGNTIQNNQWYEYGPINAWSMALTLDGEEYGFKPGTADSNIKIKLDIQCPPAKKGDADGIPQCDQFYAFSIGDSKYVNFMHDLDKGVWGGPSHEIGGVFAYPVCNAGNTLLTGNPSELLNGINDDWETLRHVSSGGVGIDMPRLSPIVLGGGPVTFEFINNAVADTFTVKVYHEHLPVEGLECVYQGAAPFCQDFIVYQSIDAKDDDPIRILSYEVTSTNTGWDGTDCLNSGSNPGDQCVDNEEPISIEFNVDDFDEMYTSSSAHTVSLYFNGKVYACAFTPNTASNYLCASDCVGLTQCSPMTFTGNDCNNDHGIKLLISNPTDDYAVFSSIKITTTGSFYGVDSFCATGPPHNFEIDGTLYSSFLISPADPPVCGLGLLSNYNSICVSNGVECLPENLLITFDSTQPGVFINNAVIEDDSQLNREVFQCCDVDGMCCANNCCTGLTCDTSVFGGTCVENECDESKEGAECNDNSQCPSCMRCCKGRKICEYPPNVAAYEDAYFNLENQHVYPKEKFMDNSHMVGYIILVGVIAFILINNMFIGCWCLKRSNASYAKVDNIINDE